jgi:hypothetical protein
MAFDLRTIAHRGFEGGGIDGVEIAHDEVDVHAQRSRVVQSRVGRHDQVRLR